MGSEAISLKRTFMAVAVLSVVISLMCVSLGSVLYLDAPHKMYSARQDNPPVVSVSATPVTGIAPLNVSFTSTATSENNTIASYQWSFKDGNYNNSQNNWHVFQSAGTYNVTCTAYDNESLSGYDWIIIEVAPNQLPVANSTSSQLSGIVPHTVSFKANATDSDGTIESFRWDFGDGNYSDEENPTHEYMTYGSFQVQCNVTDDKGGVSYSYFEVYVEKLTVDFKNIKTFMTEPSKVKFVFSLRDQNQNAVEWDPDFIKENTRIYEDTTEIDYTETTYFVHTAENLEMEIVLVLDFTNSMSSWQENGSNAIDVMVDSAHSLIDSQSPAARLAVIEYHDRNVEPAVLKNFTTNKQAVKDSITQFKDSGFDPGSSRCWDAVDIGLDLFTKDDEMSIGTVKLLVFLSDGKDTSSTSTTYGITSKAQNEQISIYNIGVGDVVAADQTTLEGMSADTGGKFYSAESLDDLETSFAEIADDLGGQYVISYLTLRTSGYHDVKVQMDYYGSQSTFTKNLDLGSIFGDDRVGAITFDQAQIEDKSADVYVRATHVPRNIDEFQFKLNTTKTVTVVFPTREEGGICEGWSSSESGGKFTVSGSSEIEFGNFGILFILRISGISESFLSIPVTFDNWIYSDDDDNDGKPDKRFDHPSTIILYGPAGGSSTGDDDEGPQWWPAGFVSSGMTPDGSLAVDFDKCKVVSEEEYDEPTDGKVTLTTTYEFSGSCASSVSEVHLYLETAGSFYPAYDNNNDLIEITPSGGEWEFEYTLVFTMDKSDYDAQKASSGGNPGDMNYAAVGWTDEGKYDIDEKTADYKLKEETTSTTTALPVTSIAAVGICGALFVVFLIILIIIIVVVVKKKGKKKDDSETPREETPAPPPDASGSDGPSPPVDGESAPPPPDGEAAPPAPDDAGEPPAPPGEGGEEPPKPEGEAPPAPAEGEEPPKPDDAPPAPDEDGAPAPPADAGEAPPPPPA